MVLSKFFTRFSKGDRQKSENNNHVTGEVIGDKGKLCQCRILLLDDTEFSLDVKTGAKGHLVLNCVFEHLNLLEKDYFGLRYLDETNQTHWLEPGKNIGSQLKTPAPHTLYFGAKFYAADPCKLHEEITRYQFFLQLKKDVLQGRLPVQFDLATELCAYAVQSELGDVDPKRHTFGYVSEFRFVPNQTEEFEDRVMALHRTLMGQVPASAEYRYLDKAKWLEMYGVDLHPVLGESNLEYFLGLTPTGIVVYRNKQKVGSYFWPRLTKVTFKGKMFLVRVKDKNNEENTYAFDCATKPACKHLWKCCIEHHAFFRLTSANESYKEKGKLFSFGSKHRYSGRTEKQALADASNRQPPKVVRRPSKRHQRRESVESMPNGFKPYHRESDIDNAIMMGPDHEPHGRDKGYQSAPESPRSCRSVPWENKHKSGGLFTSGGQSPTSVVSERMMFPRRPCESESEGGPRRRHHKSRADPSDSDGEYLYRKCRVPAEYTEASESESELRTKHRKYRKSSENINQHDNWLETQRRIRDGGYQGPLQLKPHISGRSKSPGNRKPPEELAEHFRYIDPEVESIPKDMIVDIPYTSVQTAEILPKFKQHAHRRHRSKSPKTNKSEMLEKAGSAVGSIISASSHHHPQSHHQSARHSQHIEAEPPPPYTENHQNHPHAGGGGGLHPPIQPTYNVQRGQLVSSAAAVSSNSAHSNAQHGPGQYKPSHSYGQLQHPEYDSMRSPVSVQRNETYTAPIVKTNIAKSYNNGQYSQPPPYTLSGQSMYNTKQSSGQGFHDHMREDSGLGIESNNSSAQGSPASYTQQQQQQQHGGGGGNNHHTNYSHNNFYSEQYFGVV